MTDPTSPGDPAVAQPAQPAAPYAASAPATGEDSGRTLGIVGLVLALLPGLQLIGLILGIVGLTKSKRAGAKNGLAVAAIWISAVLMVLGDIATVVAVSLGSVVLLPFIEGYAEVCAEFGTGVWEVDGIEYDCP